MIAVMLKDLLGFSLKTACSKVLHPPDTPPCFVFTGDNGGATSPGVTDKEITIAYRRSSLADLMSIITQIAGGAGLPPVTAQDVERTFDGLVDYINKHFQLYGRKLKFVPFDAKGSPLVELFGGGQDAAAADAATAATDVGAFADITAITVPWKAWPGKVST